MGGMQHSITAKYAARPVARFVRPNAQARERRLGLPGAGAFKAAASRSAVLSRPEIAPLVRLRAAWRAVRPAAVRSRTGAPIRPAATMRWSTTGPAGRPRRTAVEPAPWRG
jgi:hypothetical protein